MLTQKYRLSFMAGGACVLLSIPFIGMQFTEEINWSAFDFLVMGILLSGTIACAEGILRRFKRKSERLWLLTLTIAAFLVIWVELAVGLFGSPFAGS